ncbi:chorismate-binding protein [Bacteroidota bacterium]
MIESTTRTTKGIYSKYNDLTLLREIIGWAISNNYSFALWKLPQSNSRHLIIDTSSERTTCLEPEIESLSPCFIFSPYDNDDNKKWMFIPARIHLLISNNVDSEKISYTFDKSISDHNQLHEIESFVEKSEDLPQELNFYTQPAEFSDEACQKSHFINMIEGAISEIEKGIFEKVVPSRIKKIDLAESINLLDSFWNMTCSYLNSFISLVSSPSTGTWIGATPEILISVEDRMFHTTALAATQRHTGQEDLRKVSWTQKEIEEQAMVSRYIINCFKRIRLREFEEHGPKTIKAGNLLHLKTDYSVDMIARDFPLLGTVMLKLLHPTSAICGMPKNEAMEFLKKNELFNRQFFGGFLGPVNIDDQTSLFVNLRCGQVQEDSILLYTGAGVTIDSDPEKEWEETEVKCETLERFLSPS